MEHDSVQQRRLDDGARVLLAILLADIARDGLDAGAICSAGAAQNRGVGGENIAYLTLRAAEVAWETSLAALCEIGQAGISLEQYIGNTCCPHAATGECEEDRIARPWYLAHGFDEFVSYQKSIVGMAR